MPSSLGRRAAQVGGAIVVLAWAAALFAPILSPYDPAAFERMQLAPPGSTHWLGTDEIGRDVLSRLLFGARSSLLVGWLAVVIAISIGTVVGLVAGWGGGVVDAVAMRSVDLLLAFPRLFLALLVIAFWGPSAWLVTVVLGLTGWMTTARLVRAQVLALRDREFIVAARAVGMPVRRLLWRHLLPQCTGTIVVAATLMLGNTILAESALSFLGLGVQVPDASWGGMLNEARGVWRSAWWLALFPGVLITCTVIAHNLLGDGLRDWLDPRMSRIESAERGNSE